MLKLKIEEIEQQISTLQDKLFLFKLIKLVENVKIIVSKYQGLNLFLFLNCSHDYKSYDSSIRLMSLTTENFKIYNNRKLSELLEIEFDSMGLFKSNYLNYDLFANSKSLVKLVDECFVNNFADSFFCSTNNVEKLFDLIADENMRSQCLSEYLSRELNINSSKLEVIKI